MSDAEALRKALRALPGDSDGERLMQQGLYAAIAGNAELEEVWNQEVNNTCKHWWFAITHRDATGAYTARCFRCGKERTEQERVLPAREGSAFFRPYPAEKVLSQGRAFVLAGSAVRVTVWEFDSTERAHAQLSLAELLGLDALLVRANSLDAVKRNHAGWIAGREVVFPHES